MGIFNLFTFIDPETNVALPPSMVNEIYKRVDVSSTSSAAHYCVALDHWELLQ